MGASFTNGPSRGPGGGDSVAGLLPSILLAGTAPRCTSGARACTRAEFTSTRASAAAQVDTARTSGRFSPPPALGGTATPQVVAQGRGSAPTISPAALAGGAPDLRRRAAVPGSVLPWTARSFASSPSEVRCHIARAFRSGTPARRERAPIADLRHLVWLRRRRRTVEPALSASPMPRASASPARTRATPTMLWRALDPPSSFLFSLSSGKRILLAEADTSRSTPGDDRGNGWAHVRCSAVVPDVLPGHRWVHAPPVFPR